MDKLLDEFRLGQVVISKRGKDAGRAYVIVGFLDADKLILADAKRFNILHPKSKNPKHVQPTSHFFAETVRLLEKGKNINHGELCRFLATLCGECL